MYNNVTFYKQNFFVSITLKSINIMFYIVISYLLSLNYEELLPR